MENRKWKAPRPPEGGEVNGKWKMENGKWRHVDAGIVCWRSHAITHERPLYEVKINRNIEGHG